MKIDIPKNRASPVECFRSSVGNDYLSFRRIYTDRKKMNRLAYVTSLVVKRNGFSVKLNRRNARITVSLFKALLFVMREFVQRLISYSLPGWK